MREINGANYTGVVKGDAVKITSGPYMGQQGKVVRVMFGALSRSWCDYLVYVKIGTETRGINKEAIERIG